VLLAALPDRLHARFFVEGFVATLLGSTVDDEVRLADEIVEDPRGLHASLLELRKRVRIRGVYGMSLAYRELRLEVRLRLRDADQAHVVLQRDRVGDALADRPVSVDCDLGWHGEGAPRTERWGD